jgi:hypothetical protein
VIIEVFPGLVCRAQDCRSIRGVLDWSDCKVVSLPFHTPRRPVLELCSQVLYWGQRKRGAGSGLADARLLLGESSFAG